VGLASAIRRRGVLYRGGNHDPDVVMLQNNRSSKAPDLSMLRIRATNLRRHMLTMARDQSAGYIGQGLGIADVLAAL
jgi:hypothetical protein